MSIFKPYDIRGVYPSEINEKIIYNVGKAFASFLNCKKAVVGRDMRLSSETLYNALVKGLTEMGSDVINIGVVSTPMFYYAVATLNADAGLMITASHNPKEYNGLKPVRAGAVPIVESELKEIEKITDEKIFNDDGKTGIITTKDVFEDYISYVKGWANGIKGLKVVIDCGNGMAGKTITRLLKEFKIDTTAMYTELDGNFPNHDCNPLKPENTADLQKKVVKLKADVGVAFDGDVDRAIFVTEKGERVSGDITTALLAKQILSKRKEKILYDLRSSKAVPELVKEMGGTPVVSRVGHTFIKDKMRKEGIYFGGEISGHYYFKDNFYTDSGDIATLLMLSLLSTEKKPLSELVKQTQRYYQSGEISKNVQSKEAVLLAVENFYKKGKISKIDGLTVEFDDWWFNLRESNTEPLIRLNLEADSEELMREKVSEVLNLVH